MPKDELITLDALYKEIAGLPVLQIQVPIQRDGDKLILSREAVEALYAMDTTGRLHAAVDTSGRFTEASAATIATQTTNTANYTSGLVNQGQWGIPPTVLTTALPYNTNTVTNNFRHKKKVVALAAVDGGGAVAATELVGTVAGYYPVIDSVLIISDTADAATTFTFARGGTGTLVGAAVHVLALVASTMNTQLEDLLLYDTTDADTLTVAVSGGTAGALIWVQVEYHYET